jgi:hypothetical protein
MFLVGQTVFESYGELEAMRTRRIRLEKSLNSKSSYSPSDLPNHLHPVLEERDAVTIPITLWAAPEQAERHALKDALPNGQQTTWPEALTLRAARLVVIGAGSHRRRLRVLIARESPAPTTFGWNTQSAPRTAPRTNPTKARVFDITKVLAGSHGKPP